MVEDARARTATLIAEGKSEQEVVVLNPLAEYGEQWSWQVINTEAMPQQIYRGLKRSP